jgi:hypothetical protein
MERAGPEALAKAMSRLLTEAVDETGPELARIVAGMRDELQLRPLPALHEREGARGRAPPPPGVLRFHAAIAQPL